MSTSREPLAMSVDFDKDRLFVELDDGRLIALPLEWFPRLRDADDETRRKWELIGDGEGIYWPALDEHLSVRGFLALDAGPLPDSRSRRRISPALADSDSPESNGGEPPTKWGT
jgi:hypothetical protein